jgi:hypothetical protein
VLAFLVASYSRKLVLRRLGLGFMTEFTMITTLLQTR